jgi:hypothetical protein
MRKNFILPILILITSNGYSQFVEQGAFKIFRGSVAGADINFRLESNNTYEIYVVKFWCSLCDFDSMNKNIYQKGQWTISNDSIRLMQADTNVFWYFKILNNLNLKPLFFVNREFYSIKNDSLRNKMLTNTLNNDLFDFKLLYETYDNGVLKNATYRFGKSKNEYLILFEKSGDIKRIEKYRNGKKTNKIIK